MGDAAVWANRLRTGADTLATLALKGKSAVLPEAGGDHSETEIARAVAYLARRAASSPSPPR